MKHNLMERLRDQNFPAETLNRCNSNVYGSKNLKLAGNVFRFMDHYCSKFEMCMSTNEFFMAIQNLQSLI